MIDWHSHVLPALDDGSKDVAESVSMLKALASQGVSTVIATPHFYANDESVDSFIERREKSYMALKKSLPEGAIDVLLGAEVRYYQGISRLEDLKRLRIEGSKLLLLEMPMSAWTEYMVRELVELSGKGGFKVILAHVERYMNLQSADVWDRISESGILKQVNATFFTSFLSKRKALSLLKHGEIHFVGTDCHNMTTRSPQICKAFENIEKKLGGEYISKMNEHGYSLLGTVN